jgi:hypothetical protein
MTDDKSDDATYERDLNDLTSAILGIAPDGFTEKVKTANALCEHLVKWQLDYSIDLDDDIMILSALAAYMSTTAENQRNPHGFTARVKQIIQWLAEPSEETKARLDRMTDAEKAGREPIADRELLENKIREISRQVAMRLYKTEGFFLLIFNNGPGWVTHSSSASREDQIGMLQRHLRWLVAEESKNRIDS